MFLSFWPKNISKSNKDSFDFRSLYFKVSAVAKVCRRIMWGGWRGRLHEFRALFLFEQCVVSFFPLKPFWLKTDLDLDLGEGGDNCTYHSKKQTFYFVGSIYQVKWLVRDLFLFSYFFSWFVTSSKAMYMRSVGLGIGLSFFDLDRYSFMYKLCMYVRHVDMKMFDTWRLNIDFLPTLG